MHPRIFAACLIMMGCISNLTLAQSSGSNPWAPTELGPLPPIASLTDGVWLKGDLHLHSRHSKDSSNNSEAKIIQFSESVGMDYIGITDHDNHVGGDVAHNVGADRDLHSFCVVVLRGAMC